MFHVCSPKNRDIFVQDILKKYQSNKKSIWNIYLHTALDLCEYIFMYGPISHGFALGKKFHKSLFIECFIANTMENDYLNCFFTLYVNGAGKQIKINRLMYDPQQMNLHAFLKKKILKQKKKK